MTKKKILLVITIILLVAGAGIGGAFAYVKITAPKHISIEIRYDDKDAYVVYDSISGAFHQTDGTIVKGGTLYIENSLSEEDNDVKTITVYVENDGECVMQLTLESGQKDISLSLPEPAHGDYTLSFTIERNDCTEYYINSEASFNSAMSAISQTGTVSHIVNMTSSINIAATENGYLSISAPFVWNTCGYQFTTENKLFFRSESSEGGTMVINNLSVDDMVADEIICHTPSWNYTITVPFGSFTEENYFFVNASKVNEKPIDTSTIYVDTQEKLEFILQDKHFKLADGTTCVALSGNVHISAATEIVIDEPDIDILWDGVYAFSEADAEQFMNVRSYNGSAGDIHIGGTGRSFFASGTISGMSLTVSGNYLNVTTRYTDNFDITAASIDGVFSDSGTGEIVNEGENYYYVITDSQGETYGYKINVSSADYCLPVIYITTENGKDITSKETYTSGSFTIDYNGYAGSSGFQILENASMQIRGRGNSTWLLDKKPYKIKFDSKTSLFGLTKSKEWVLLANHVDCSLMRNTVALSMASILDNMLFVPHSYMVDVFVNGEYMGVYSLSEQIEIKDGRIEGEKDSTEVDTDYLLEWGGTKKTTTFGDNVFATTVNGYVTVEEPDETILTKEQFDYIKQCVRDVDAAIKAGDYEELIDVDSFVDFFILNEITFNADGTMRRSNFILKKKGGKFYYAAPWDYDYAFENLYVGKYYEEWLYDGTPLTDAFSKGPYINENWLSLLMEDDNFRAKVKARWNEIKDELYTTAISTIDTTYEVTAPSAAENFTKWNILGQKFAAQNKATASLDTYEKQVEFLRDFIIKRYTWMDKTISQW